MKCLIVLFAAVAVSSAQLLPFAALQPLRTQYHVQDELGQYSFGYTGGPSSKQESRTGPFTQGAFSYVDAHGIVQSRSYAADPVNGFRVAGTDIPVDANTPVIPAVHPVVALARRKRSAYAYVAPITPTVYHAAAPGFVAAPTLYNAAAIVRAHAPAVYAAPAPAVYAAPAPAVYAAPIAPVAPAVSSQYQSQNELGEYSYGYSNPTSSKTETRLANGVTQGAYSYLDANGLVQSAQYTSDPAHGFRVAATNLPVAAIHA